MEKNKDYFIIDDFINKEEQDRLEDLIFKTKITWFLSEDPLRTVPEDVHLRELKVFPNIFEYGQFVHLIVSYNPNTNKGTNNSDIVNSIYDVLRNTAQFFKSNIDVLRAKINLQTKVYLSNSEAHNTPHTDLPISGDSYWTMTYYINDSDGPLRIFDSDNNVVECIEPKKGRAIIFKNHIRHCGIHPTKNNFRSVLNLNFAVGLPEELDKKV